MNLKWGVCILICIGLFSMIRSPSLQTPTPSSSVFIVGIFFYLRDIMVLTGSRKYLVRCNAVYRVWLWRMAPEPLSPIWPQPSLWLWISHFISICKIIRFNCLIPVASCHFFLKIFLAGWLRIFPNHWTVLEYNPFTVMNCKLFFFCSLRNKNVLKCTVCPVFLQASRRDTFWDSAIELFVNGCRKISYTYD